MSKPKKPIPSLDELKEQKKIAEIPEEPGIVPNYSNVLLGLSKDVSTSTYSVVSVNFDPTLNMIDVSSMEKKNVGNNKFVAIEEFKKAAVKKGVLNV